MYIHFREVIEKIRKIGLLGVALTVEQHLDSVSANMGLGIVLCEL